MDKRQAEGIANAMLMGDRASKDGNRRLYGWQKIGTKAGRFILAYAILGAVISISLRYLLAPAALMNAGTMMIAEWGACAGFILGFCIVSWRHFSSIRLRKLETQQRFSEQSHNHGEHHT